MALCFLKSIHIYDSRCCLDFEVLKDGISRNRERLLHLSIIQFSHIQREAKLRGIPVVNNDNERTLYGYGWFGS